MIRDARAADRAAKDHTGRWPFELLQKGQQRLSVGEARLISVNVRADLARKRCAPGRIAYRVPQALLEALA